jgi:hypothetical protein
LSARPDWGFGTRCVQEELRRKAVWEPLGACCRLTMFEAKPASVLIVVVDDDDDDDALIRELVALEFRDAGFDVVEAHDASDDLTDLGIMRLRHVACDKEQALRLRRAGNVLE